MTLHNRGATSFILKLVIYLSSDIGSWLLAVRYCTIYTLFSNKTIVLLLGVQYCCNDYIAILQKAGVKVSMTEEQHVYENAMAERVNGILKWEFGLNSKFKTKEEAYRVLNEAIHLYNSYRPHLSLNYKTPDKIYFNEI